MQCLVVFKEVQESMGYSFGSDGHKYSRSGDAREAEFFDIFEKNIRRHSHRTVMFCQKSSAVTPGYHARGDNSGNTYCYPSPIHDLQHICSKERTIEEQKKH